MKTSNLLLRLTYLYHVLLCSVVDTINSERDYVKLELTTSTISLRCWRQRHNWTPQMAGPCRRKVSKFRGAVVIEGLPGLWWGIFCLFIIENSCPPDTHSSAGPELAQFETYLKGFHYQASETGLHNSASKHYTYLKNKQILNAKVWHF